jgi:hypothetical protein
MGALARATGGASLNHSFHCLTTGLSQQLAHFCADRPGNFFSPCF